MYSTTLDSTLNNHNLTNPTTSTQRVAHPMDSYMHLNDIFRFIAIRQPFYLYLMILTGFAELIPTLVREGHWPECLDAGTVVDLLVMVDPVAMVQFVAWLVGSDAPEDEAQ
ncbi:hypothetical protein LTR53_000263 [Teratosphaeriaceae sp. CCFEE 6253]|nr:hypothetical protein LTR53_000263 [Teratosphaeriaceae sp. CCFEE 6253]